MQKINISFNKEPEGLLTEPTVRALFGNPEKVVGVAEGLCSIVVDPLNSTEKVLQVTYPNGVIQPDKTRWHYKFDPVETATVTYKVMVPEGFDFVRGGKLPGFYGGTAPRGGASTDAGDGFSARVMWREGGALFQYMYWMERAAEKKWGDDLPWTDLEGDKTPLKLIPGQWHTLKTQVVLNTPGSRDGTVTSWLDGKLAVREVGAFRAEGQTYGIDTFAFTTFFGGNDPTWAPTKEEHVYFGDIAVELGTEEIVNFKLSEEFTERANKLFEEQKNLLHAKFPFADIQHIGGTAVQGLLTKGDLDINVRVALADFQSVVTELKSLYEINQPENWSDNYASFKNDSIELGIQVTVIDSNKDFFVLHRDELQKRPDLVAQLNQLKSTFEGKCMSDYRTAKGIFLRQHIKYHYDKIPQNESN